MPICNKIIGIKVISEVRMTDSEKILKFAEENGGTVTTQQINELNIHRTTLKVLVGKGLLEHSSRGVYILPTQFDDEFYSLQVRYKKGVFSNGTALFLLNFTDRTPIKFDMTFSASYNTSLINNNVTTHRVKEELYKMGIIAVSTPCGNKVNVYCIERTLCDILQKRNAVDIQVITAAFKAYSKCKERNIPLLSQYAKMFRVEKKVRPYLEVLI